MRKQFIERITACNTIKIKELRELYWLLSSESLSETLVPEHHFTLVSKINLSNLLEIFRNELQIGFPKINQKIRLGKYVEILIKFFLETYSEYVILGNQIQLIENKQTKGEIDFLIQKEETHYIHLEFAIKYYIKYKMKDTFEYWGPNFNDSWARKKLKIVDFQSELTNIYPHLLPQEFQGKKFEKKILILGSVFHEPNIESTNWSLHFDEIKKLNQKGVYFRWISNKQEWVFPFSSIPQVYSYSQIRSELVKGNKEAKLVVCYDQKKIPTSWGFILYNTLPNRYS
jgi:hypothetical protein